MKMTNFFAIGTVFVVMSASAKPFATVEDLLASAKPVVAPTMFESCVNFLANLVKPAFETQDEKKATLAQDLFKRLVDSTINRVELEIKKVSPDAPAITTLTQKTLAENYQQIRPIIVGLGEEKFLAAILGLSSEWRFSVPAISGDIGKVTLERAVQKHAIEKLLNIGTATSIQILSQILLNNTPMEATGNTQISTGAWVAARIEEDLNDPVKQAHLLQNLKIAYSLVLKYATETDRQNPKNEIARSLRSIIVAAPFRRFSTIFPLDLNSETTKNKISKVRDQNYVQYDQNPYCPQNLKVTLAGREFERGGDINQLMIYLATTTANGNATTDGMILGGAAAKILRSQSVTYTDNRAAINFEFDPNYVALTSADENNLRLNLISPKNEISTWDAPISLFTEPTTKRSGHISYDFESGAIHYSILTGNDVTANCVFVKKNP
jgi:hypothetical protein